MNWVDLVILLVISVFILEGQKRGFFAQILDILGFLFSLILALIFYPQAAELFIKVFNIPKIAANPIGFLSIWIIAEAIFFSLLSIFVGKIIHFLSKTKINQYLGFIPAVANGLLFTAFILLFVVSLPVRPDIKKDIFDSKIGSNLVEKAQVLETPLSGVFGPIAKQTLTFLTVNPHETGSIPLEFTQNQLTVDAVSEQRMFELVNQERVKFGVKPLVWDERLAEVGREHSKDMFKRGYFSHYSPEGKDVGDRLEDSSINYSLAGENLALAPDVIRAHNGLMNSEGHRRNILDPAFSKIGIGAMDGGVYGKMFTQVFTN